MHELRIHSAKGFFEFLNLLLIDFGTITDIVISSYIDNANRNIIGYDECC